MEVQPQLVLLQKTLLSIEGLGRELYPELDLWQTAKPFLERWMSEQVGRRALLKGLKENLPLWAEKLPEMPGLVHRALTQLETLPEQRERQLSELAALREELRIGKRQVLTAVTGAALLISGGLVYGLVWPGQATLLAALFAGTGLAALLLAWWDGWAR